MSDLSKSFARWPSALIWAVVGFSAVAWFLHIQGLYASRQLAPAAQIDAQSAPDTVALARLLGDGEAPVASAVAQPSNPVAGRFSLAGVVLSGGNSVALISVEGKPPKPVMIGAEVEGGWVLRHVGVKRAELSSGGQGLPSLTLELASPFK